ncbi:MAG: hypothetical protein IPF54_03515 [Draconibacterium sp.]|nr:hypothetical protein [Draconibacterium sp.]
MTNEFLLHIQHCKPFLNAGGKASDNCNLNPNTFKLESEHKSNTGCPFTLTRTYQISDWQGNKTKVIQIISVEEMEIEVASEEIQVLTLKSGMVEFIAVQNGNWNDPATWGGAGTPGLNDNVTIQNGVTVTVNVAAVCNDIIINGTLNGAGNTLQVNGSWNNSGIYEWWLKRGC